MINQLNSMKFIELLVLYILLEIIAPFSIHAQIIPSTAPSVNVLAISDQFGSGPVDESVPIDTSMVLALFQVTGATNISLLRPTGIAVMPGDADVSIITAGNRTTYQVTNPVAGSWHVILNGNGAYNLLVTGNGTLAFRKFNFVSVGGRGGHEGLIPIPGAPIIGQTTEIHGVLSGAFRTAQFEFRRPDGELLQQLAMTAGPAEAANEFLGSVVAPNEPFFVYVTGVDDNGTPFSRFIPQLMDAQTIEVQAPVNQELHPGQRTEYIFRVTNRGAPDTVLCTASDNQGFVTSVTPTTALLNSDEVVQVTVELTPPATTPVGTYNQLTLVCMLQALPTQHNSASTLNVVSSGPPPVSVPNVVGQTQASAAAALTAAGLTLGTVSTQASATVPAGIVLSQNPGAGISAPAGSPVALTISAGSPTVVPGDLNGDGKVDCSDLAIVKASFGKQSGQAGFDVRADVNGDSIVNVKDLAFVSQKLPTGTRCP